MDSSRNMWLSCAVVCTLVAVATAAGEEYLPPSKGYSYDPPKIPFPTDLNGNKQPTPGPYRPPPTPGYRPQPTPPRPQPPRPQPTPRPQPPQRPTYIPPPPPPNTHDHDHPHDHSHDHSHDHDHHHHHEPGMPFDFAYTVNEDGNDYSHNAISDGDVTRGEYRVALPDGRTQLVKYTADWKNGFNAEVTYEGEARYPTQNQKPGYPGQSDTPYKTGPSGTPGQAYVPPSQGGGYQY